MKSSRREVVSSFPGAEARAGLERLRLKEIELLKLMRKLKKHNGFYRDDSSGLEMMGF